MVNKCRNCKEEALPNRKYCQKHLDYINLKARERIGKCKQCNEPAVDGKSRCAKHQAEIRVKSAERKAKLKAAGLCRDCGKKTKENCLLCEMCMNKSLSRNAVKLAERQEKGLCTCCGNVKEIAEAAYCNECTKKDNARLRSRRQASKENGMCTRCNTNNSEYGNLCLACSDAVKKYGSEYRRKKVANGLCFRCTNPKLDRGIFCHVCKIEQGIRRSIWNALTSRNIPKSKSTEEILGCTITFFKQHIKNLMEKEPWMNEDNYGVHIPGERRWQIGHKIPKASFNLTDPEQLKQCFHYTNLCPQEAEENIAFGDYLFLDGILIRGRDIRS
jgi:hypothetical protein